MRRSQNLRCAPSKRGESDRTASSLHSLEIETSRATHCYYALEALTTSRLYFKAASITEGVNAGYLQYIIAVDSGNNLDAHLFDAWIGAHPFEGGLQQWLRRSPEFNMDKVQTPLQVVALGRWHQRGHHDWPLKPITREEIWILGLC
jgi:hypothetical protein